jgi:hypothetical protein
VGGDEGIGTRSFDPGWGVRIDLTAEDIKDGDEAAFAGFNRGSGPVKYVVIGVPPQPIPPQYSSPLQAEANCPYRRAQWVHFNRPNAGPRKPNLYRPR